MEETLYNLTSVIITKVLHVENQSNATDDNGYTSNTTALISSNSTIATNQSVTNNNPSSRPACIEFISTLRFVVCLCIVIPGVLGNTLSFCVLHVKSKHNVTNFMLKILAVVDNTYLIAMLSVIVTQYRGYKNQMVMVGNFVKITQALSSWTVILIGIIRCIAICRPLKVREDCTTKRATIAFILLLIFHIMIVIPFFKIDKKQLPWSSFYFRTIYIGIFYYFFVMFAIPFFSLVIINICLSRALRRSHAVVGQDHPIFHSEVAEINRVIVAIITTCLVTNLPWFVTAFLQILANTHPQLIAAMLSRQHCQWRFFLEVVITMATLINSSVNFIIYFLLRRSFRMLLKDIVMNRSAPRRRLSSETKTDRTQSF